MTGNTGWRRVAARAAAVLIGWHVAAPATAQTPALPGAARPEFQRRQFQPGPAPRASPRPPPQPAAPAVPGPSGQTFQLRNVLLEGNAAISTGELEPVWAPLIGRDVGLAELEDLAARLSAVYRSRGFILSQVVLPAQTIAGGAVRLQVIEGFIDRVEVQGSHASARDAAAKLLVPTGAQRPLRLPTLERGVLLSRDILGGTVETALAPSAATFGAADLTVTLEPRPFQGFVSIDNRASRLLGPWALRAGGSLFGQLGLNERVDVQVATSPDAEQLRFGQVLIAVPLLGRSWPFDGTVLEFGVDRTRADPRLERAGLSNFTTVTNETQLRAGLALPLIRTRPENLTLRFGVTWRDTTSESVFQGIDLGETTDRLSILDARLSWDFVDRFNGVTLIEGGLRKGIDAFGAKIGQTGPGAPEVDFVALLGGIARLQRLGAGGIWSIFAEAVGQWAPDPLPTSERFALGGDRLGRGFAPGNTTGDSGFGGRLELRRRIDGVLPARLESGLQAYVFGDWGAAIDRSSARDGNRYEALASAGGGLRLDVTRHVSINPELAVQVAGRPSDNASGERHVRFLIGSVARW